MNIYICLYKIANNKIISYTFILVAADIWIYLRFDGQIFTHLPTLQNREDNQIKQMSQLSNIYTYTYRCTNNDWKAQMSGIIHVYRNIHNIHIELRIDLKHIPPPLPPTFPVLMNFNYNSILANDLVYSFLMVSSRFHQCSFAISLSSFLGKGVDFNLNKLESPSPKDALYKVWKWPSGFKRQTDGRRTKGNQKSSLELSSYRSVS